VGEGFQVHTSVAGLESARFTLLQQTRLG